ncbi:MAG: InlB B-repeat-containing protein [Myxococcales bacterium]
MRVAFCVLATLSLACGGSNSGPGTRFNLTVQKAGSGAGLVTAPGISCGEDCSEPFASGTTVALAAQPGAGCNIAWTGCDAVDADRCTALMSSHRTVTARFEAVSGESYTLTVEKAGDGSGTVIATGIGCGSDCVEEYAAGTKVTLSALADAGAALTGWAGCDSTAGAFCTISMAAARTVGATFSASGSVVPIDCAWLQGENCWKTFLSSMAACTPVSGTFSADRKTCTSSSGATVSFAHAVGSQAQPPFDFSIESCVAVRESDASERIVRVAAPAGTATLEHKPSSLEVTCPDGSLNAILDPSTLYFCNWAEALLPDTYWHIESPPWGPPAPATTSFLFRGAEGPPAAFDMTVWSCQ